MRTTQFMMTKNSSLLLFLALIAFCSGCDSGSKPAPVAPATSTFETGRFALQKMIGPARIWNPDAQPVNLRAQAFKGSDGHGGKSGAWRATFASAARLKSEPFTWSGMVGPDYGPRGVDHGIEDSYNPSNRSMQPFDLNFLKVDSDQAFDVAQEHGGKQLLEKNPDTMVSYLLDWDARENQLKWHVSYGGSESLAKLSVIVDATTGAFVRKE